MERRWWRCSACPTSRGRLGRTQARRHFPWTHEEGRAGRRHCSSEPVRSDPGSAAADRSSPSRLPERPRSPGGDRAPHGQPPVSRDAQDPAGLKRRLKDKTGSTTRLIIRDSRRRASAGRNTSDVTCIHHNAAPGRQAELSAGTPGPLPEQRRNRAGRSGRISRSRSRSRQLDDSWASGRLGQQPSQVRSHTSDGPGGTP